ncbi:MAG: 16S rRNA (cytosine(1402)-N(4))-methyltransferase RsmH [Pseudomonadota bacterium]
MTSHFPVMLDEVLGAVNPQDNDVIVDGTFGTGGYSRAFLEKADCKVIAIDQDSNALQYAAQLEKDFGDRFLFIPGRFGDVVSLLHSEGFHSVDAFVLDVGVSSMQIDEAERGFSFQKEGPLDMRMNTSSSLTAAKIINEYKEEDIANILYEFGEEKKSRPIAKKICEERLIAPIQTTHKLTEIIHSIVPKTFKTKIDPATRSFQALRIAVNDELGELNRALEASKSILNAGGRLVVVSFHSLEDRLVKKFLKKESGSLSQGSRHFPQADTNQSPTFQFLNKNAIIATEEEILKNSRSRSAKMRSAIKLDDEVMQ